MEVQMMTVAAAEPNGGGPGRLKQQQLGEESAFAALLWMLQNGQAVADVPMVDALPGAPAVPAAAELPSAFLGAQAVMAAGGQPLGTDTSAPEQASVPGLASVPLSVAADTVSLVGADQPVPEASFAAGMEVAVNVPQAGEPAEGAPASTDAPVVRLPSPLVADAAPEAAVPVAAEQAPAALPGAGVREGAVRFEAALQAQHEAGAGSEPPVTARAEAPTVMSEPPFVVAEATGSTAQPSVTAAAESGDVPAAAWAQVVRQLEQRGQSELRPGGPTLDLQLHPAELGSVRVRLTYLDGQLAAQLHVATVAAKEALEAGLAQLRATLQAQGFEVQDLTVDVRQGGQQPSYESHGWEAGYARQQGQRHGGAHSDPHGETARGQRWVTHDYPGTGSGRLDIRA